ncbi:Hydroxylamine reductase [Methanimicrococcus sp. At1]|uniref:Hydroxylamine reductase n=1 Tax=Methanimicrococcus hacksteinii TaxID=3028293 RepID=A0ABU3VMD1_9EURY|nr:hydroxylamine reductase [Methanimicrococcus sp. At1]MDV0444489.1 Hydroxylamine reductase [Methanimicrococcus sp. At1]
MFCYQCEETMNGTGCTMNGMCGKKGEVAVLQDRLIYALKGYAFCNSRGRQKGCNDPDFGPFVMEALFSTLTNVNFDGAYFETKIQETLDRRDVVRNAVHDGAPPGPQAPNVATITYDELMAKTADEIGVLSIGDIDTRSLRETLIYGLKGISAYGMHAHILGSESEDVYQFIEKALVSTIDASPLGNPDKDGMIALLMECGSIGVKIMSMLDAANTGAYGSPVPTQVSTGVGKNPGILISGHDLKDLEMLLEQTKRSGVDVYTHGEMLPAHGYPSFQKYDNFVGNYGNSWWHQKSEFEKFNGPILMTTNCLVPPKETYAGRLFTTNMVGYADDKAQLKHIPANAEGSKDFSEIIELAKKCPPPEELENGTVMTGFAHAAVLSVADKVVEAVKAGDIKKFVVMAGCDGRRKEREYYTEFAEALPHDTVILTAGCAKYRYNKLDLGDIGGIPRVLDAGQCNDCYSLVVIALELAKAFGVETVNDLPLVFNIAWYEQKATLVFLSLLSLGVQNIVIGPTLPACISPDVLDVLVKTFNVSKNTDVESDMKRLITL